MKIKCSLDTQKFSQKPDKEDAKKITNRIASKTVEISIEELGQSLVQPNGQSFCPAVFTEGKRRNENWKSQQIFGLDFDDGITVDQVLARCQRYNVQPAVIYTTFSSTEEKPKFRVIFCCETTVEDQRLAKVIQLGLMRLFPEADKACKDGSRVFYGGQALKHMDTEVVFSPPLMVQEVCRFITDEDKAHASRNIQQWCQSVGLDMVNGLPKVLPVDEDEEKNPEIWLNATSPTRVVVYIGHVVLNQKYGFFFCQNNTKGSTGGRKYSVVNEKVERTELIRDFDFDALQDSCELYRDFLKQDYKLEHNERFGIGTNLSCIMGGQKRFMDALEFGNTKVQDRYDLDVWRYQLNYLNRQGYAPMRCDNFCPYAPTCEHARNMIDQVKLSRGTVRILRKPEYKTLEAAERELQQQFNRVLTEDTNKIYVIKAPTGIGKTKLYENLYNVTIALPTHQLKTEVAQRMKTPFQMTPEMPKDTFLEKLYDTGSYFLARKYIENEAKAKSERSEEFKEYLLQDISACKCSGNLLTTHAKLLSLQRTGTIIIDEDICSSLYPTATTTMDDLKIMAESCGSDKRDTLIWLYRMVEAAGLNIVFEMPSYGGVKTSRLESNILASQVNSNVLGFLNCTHYTKSKDEKTGTEYVTYINKRELPEKNKIIMLSATANEEICRMMFGDRLEFIDIGAVVTMGEIQQYPQKSFSRYSLEQELTGDNLKKLAKALTKEYKVITYKDAEKTFDACLHFGALEGINEYSGENLAIIGTPHNNPVKYILLANALGKKPKLNDTRTSMSFSKVKRNGMEFYFQTFSNDAALQEVQLYIIESEMEQAVGRARILRNNCRVLVLSNYPLVGAEFKYLTKHEIDQLIQA